MAAVRADIWNVEDHLEICHQGGVSTMEIIKDKMLAANGIEIVMIDIEKDGYYNPDLKMMFINKNLDETKQKEIIKALKERERIEK
jgi:hypothetical protein